MSYGFLASEYVPSPPTRAGFHILPAPLEQSVSWGGGTAHGPQALLAASQQLEAWEQGVTPGAAGLYTAPAVDCRVPVATVLECITQATAYALDCGAVPVLLGGEHTVTLGALRALAAQGEPFGVVQFDAHADLRPSYAGNPLSHACVMYRAVADLGLPLVQLAVREFSQEEADLRQHLGIVHYDADVLARCGLPECPLPADFPQQIYITFDVDGLDASLMPATGTPAPGGLFWHEAVCLLERCVRGRRVLGFDVVELAPVAGLHHADFTAAKLCHVLMALAYVANRSTA